MWVVFTDLDGTLLDHDTYSFEPARPALERLARQSVPVIFTTSKTRAEVEQWRLRLGNAHPFIVENGGAVFIPPGYFPFPLEGTVWREPYEAIEFGDPYGQLVAVLERAASRSGCRIRAFHSMSVAEVAEACALPAEQAALAKRREYDEAFEVVDASRQEALLEAIEQEGKRWTRGGRFHHILGASDKAAAVAALGALYRRLLGSVCTAGLGDGMNDAPMLRVVDAPVIIRSKSAERLRAAVPGARLTRESGPKGWNAAILEMIPE